MKRTAASAPRGLLRTNGRAGTSEHQRVLPDLRLRPMIAHFWWVSWSFPEPFVTETLPHPSVHLTFESASARGEIGGPAPGRFVRTLEGSGHVFGIKFRPAAFQPLLGAALSTLQGTTLAIERVFGTAGIALGKAMQRATDFEARIELAEAFFLPRARPLPSEVERMRDLVERMADDRSLVRVEDAAALVELDVRALQRRFRRYVGVTPKWVLMRYRLHEAVERLKGKRPPSLAALAAELGYTDQAHFARDFKAVVGRTTAEFARNERAR